MLVDTAHALAAATRDRLDQHRVADLVGLLLEELRVLQFAVIAGHDRHAGLLHQRLGLVLQPHGADRRWRRADEHDAGRRAGLGELRVLGQEAVARMDAVGVRERRRLDDLVDHQIAVARGWRADQISLVCDAHVQRSRIGLRIDRDHAHAEALRGARDAHGDLATIGDQDRTEHRKVLAQGRAEWHGRYRVVLRLTAWGQDSAKAAPNCRISWPPPAAGVPRRLGPCWSGAARAWALRSAPAGWTVRPPAAAPSS